MALINSKISPLSCFASTNPNSLPKFLVSKFHGTVASSSPANTTKRSSPSNVYLPVSNYLRRFDHKISIARLWAECDSIMLKSLIREEISQAFKYNEWLQSLLRVAECDSIMLKSLIREEISQAFK
ncbi:hypothetical protein F2Q70_00001670 [Brassica cretica]|uniref:Uncharacterized protein n=1 Tax=Brassica cretica TaxID=69181 RepID=A0A8S9IJZ5_BRACR|nr:hypothetical protein F2Q70_00001670 [Brassica cretica]